MAHGHKWGTKRVEPLQDKHANSIQYHGMRATQPKAQPQHGAKCHQTMNPGFREEHAMARNKGTCRKTHHAGNRRNQIQKRFQFHVILGWILGQWHIEKIWLGPTLTATSNVIFHPSFVWKESTQTTGSYMHDQRPFTSPFVHHSRTFWRTLPSPLPSVPVNNEQEVRRWKAREGRNRETDSRCICYLILVHCLDSWTNMIHTLFFKASLCPSICFDLVPWNLQLNVGKAITPVMEKSGRSSWDWQG